MGGTHGAGRSRLEQQQQLSSYFAWSEPRQRANVKSQLLGSWKNVDTKQGGEKYVWHFGKQGCPPGYILPGTAEAIAAAAGAIYLAAGEVDVLSDGSASIRNKLSWLNGESTRRG